MSNLTFAFGGNTGETPESLARKRLMVEALLQRGTGSAPRDIGEGLSAIGQAIAGRVQLGRIAKQQTAGQQAANAAFAPIQNALFAPNAPDNFNPAPTNPTFVPENNNGNFIQRLFSGGASNQNERPPASTPQGQNNPSTVGLSNQQAGDLGRQLAQLTSRNETGGTDLAQGSFQIANDTGGTKSYGFLGVNSGSGSAAQFARENPSLGLTARPGTAEFDAQWRRAAQNNPEALVQAQLNYQERNIHGPARQRLEEAGLGRFANDPRALSFVGDTVVQFGAEGARSSVNAGRNAQSVEEFINSASQFQLNNVDSRFRTYLSENPQNRQGILNRLNRRREQALGLQPTTGQRQQTQQQPAPQRQSSAGVQSVTNQQLFSVINNPFASRSQISTAQTILNQRLAADAPLTRAQREGFSRQDRNFNAGRQDRAEDVQFRNQEAQISQFNTNRQFDVDEEQREFSNNLETQRFDLQRQAAEREAQTAQNEINRDLNQRNSVINQVNEAVDSVINVPGSGSTVTVDGQTFNVHPGLVDSQGSIQGLLPSLLAGGRNAQNVDDFRNGVKSRLQGQAFRAAFESLKGGGQITEFESKSAAAALAAIESDTLSPEEFVRQTLILQNSITSGLQKLNDGGQSQQTAPQQQLNQAQNNAIEAARAAIARGAPREAVLKRLQENGISIEGL